jgi:hypothetical protein
VCFWVARLGGWPGAIQKTQPKYFKIRYLINHGSFRGRACFPSQTLLIVPKLLETTELTQYNATLLFYPHLPGREIDTFNIIPQGRMRRWKDPKPPTPSPTFEPYNGLNDVPPQEPISQGTGGSKRKATVEAATCKSALTRRLKTQI